MTRKPQPKGIREGLAFRLIFHLCLSVCICGFLCGPLFAASSRVEGAYPLLPAGCQDGEVPVFNGTTGRWECGAGGGGGGGGTPGGSNGEFQYRQDATTFGGVPGMSYVAGTGVNFFGGRLRVDTNGDLLILNSSFQLFGSGTVPVTIGSATHQGTVHLRGGNTSSIAGITVANMLRANTTNTPGTVAGIQSPSAAVRGMIIQGAASQSANLFEFRDSANTFLTGFDPLGNFSGTAAALAGTPTLCASGQAARGILAGGNATGCFEPPTTRVCSATFSNTNDPDELDGSACALTYADGLRALVTPSAAIEAATSLDLGGGLKPIYKQADGTNVTNGDIASKFVVAYEPAWNSGNGAWKLISLPDTPFRKLSVSIDHGSELSGLTDNDHHQYPLLACNSSSELTLDTNGDITIPAGGGCFRLDTFADAATDTLDTMNGTAGNCFVLTAENASRVVTIDASAIKIKGAVNFALNQTGDYAYGCFSATNTARIRDVYDEAGEIAASSFRVGAGGPFKTDLIFDFYNGGSALAAGQTRLITIPYACNITKWDLVADQSGSVIIDLYVDTYANWPPTNADSITASSTPALSSAQKNQDTDVTDWTELVPANSYILATIEGSPATILEAWLRITCDRQ